MNNRLGAYRALPGSHRELVGLKTIVVMLTVIKYEAWSMFNILCQDSPRAGAVAALAVRCMWEGSGLSESTQSKLDFTSLFCAKVQSIVEIVLF